MKTRTEITIETEKLLVVGGRRRRMASWCAPCGQYVEMLTTDAAALLAGVGSRTIFRRVESGSVHYTETPEGLVLICPNSIF
jgi:hypothetical protein